jgi:hypothetical protein
MQLEEIWKTTSIFLKMEDNLNFFSKEDDLNIFFLIEDNIQKIMQPKIIKSKNNNIFENGRRSQIFFEKGRRPQFFLNG